MTDEETLQPDAAAVQADQTLPEAEAPPAEPASVPDIEVAAAEPNIEQEADAAEPDVPATAQADAATAPQAEATEAPEADALPFDATEAPEADATTAAKADAATAPQADALPLDATEAPEADARPTEPPSAAAEEPAVEAPAPAPVLMVRRTVSQEIARRLHAAGARFCFTVPGESFLPLIDDLDAAGIRVITTRHESGAAFMAEAVAQSTGRPQVVLVTRTVGAANASIGIHTARQDSAPMVTIVGQVDRSLLGREAFQESDIVSGIGALASWAAQVDDPARLVPILDGAWTRLTSGRPGPIVLAVPQDVLAEEIELPDEPPAPLPGAHGPAADRAAVSRIMKMLAASERGVIVAGGGVLRSRATKRLIALSEALAVPVIASWRRPDVFPNDHANYLGMTGFWSPGTVRKRLEDADAILFIGTRMSETATFGYSVPGPDTVWAHVDVEPRTAHAGLSAPSISVRADASRFLDSAWSDLRAAALDAEMRGRREARNAADREAYRDARAVGQGAWTGPGVHPGRIIDMLRVILPDNATLTTDAGNFSGWAARGFRFRRAGTFIGPTSGSMGYGLPAAIAASLQDPDRIAVAICGDGGLAMSIAELETAVREGAHPIVIVFDNERFGTIAMQQAREGRSTDSSALGPVDWAAAARAFGALGFSVQDDTRFESAMREAITSRRTSVLHVALDASWVSVDDNPLATPQPADSAG